ncbi:probable basic-leucine zipper transcription factor J isoform X2 [Toxorhynchites rutilus septentrionalis]|uniref:probable basic-leucine zipper transcription factor J isoform X2 n=1 Tax=Toxorhynchites rutilus septentrionalis TaxID=329112 RepID=UPI002479FEF5|nr:probable basic-leucine zipper transcription factor J isoform X2 [Toxorhynchites rutilus septentrionalis]
MDMEEAVNFLPEEWPSNPDDFMDLFQLDTNLLFNDSSSGVPNGPDGMNDITSSLINNLQNGFNYGDVCAPTSNIPIEQALMSPISSLESDQEFHGFPNSSGTSLDGSGYEDDFIAGHSTAEGSSPSSLSSSGIKMELDDAAMDEFCTFERNVQQQAISSAASDSGLSSDNLDFEPSGDYEALSPALSSPGPSISERGGQNSPPRHVKPSIPPPQIIVQEQPQIKTTTLAVPTVATPKPAHPKVGKVYHTVKTVLSSGNNNNNKDLPQPQTQTTHLANGKEVKIYRVASVKNGQTVNVANGTNANKKVTLQLKNGMATAVTGKTNGTVFINNKNVVLTSAPGNGSTGVRKIIRVQQQQQQNGRSILVPVSIQDLRTIKIVNSANLKTKSANIKLAAANLLQQSKQGLIQKNVVLSKEQLMVDDGDTTQNSDNESFVFEDIMQQSNSVIEQVERHHQKQRHQQPMVSESDDEMDDDLDGDDSMCSVGNGMNAAGGYQKLILTAEEKRLLEKEGISLPSSYPLTKHEERELKRIRRKIRNKISAQDSRKRKKEYVDGLEERVKQCTEENQTLLKRIKILQSQNHDLMSQMKKIQSLLTKGTGKTTQPATCLMVLLLSMALVAVPNLKLGGSHQQQNIQDSIEMAELLQDAAQDKIQVQTQVQNRRSLLFDTKEQLGDALVDEEMNFDEVMSFNVNSMIANEHDYSTEEEPPKVKRAKMSSLVEYDVDDDIWNGSSKMRIKMEIEEKQNTLINPKDKQFSNAFNQSPGLNIKTEHSEVIVDRDLLESMSKKGMVDLYNSVSLDQLERSTDAVSKYGHNIELLNTGIVANAGSVEEVSKKLNASQQIQQLNSKRKLLL